VADVSGVAYDAVKMAVEHVLGKITRELLGLVD
jgi:hypothetical protein